MTDRDWGLLIVGGILVIFVAVIVTLNVVGWVKDKLRAKSRRADEEAWEFAESQAQWVVRTDTTGYHGGTVMVVRLERTARCRLGERKLHSLTIGQVDTAEQEDWSARLDELVVLATDRAGLLNGLT